MDCSPPGSSMVVDILLNKLQGVGEKSIFSITGDLGEVLMGEQITFRKDKWYLRRIYGS